MKRLLPGLIISIIFFFFCLITLSDYGMNEDTPGHFLRGQTYLHKLITGQDFFSQPKLPSPLLFIPGQRISIYKFSAYEDQFVPPRPIANFPGTTVQEIFQRYQADKGRQSFYKHNQWAMDYQKDQDGGHPPVSDILASVTNAVFYEKLGILGDIESYYVYIVFTASIALFALYYFILKIFGKRAAIISTVTLALYPLFFAEAHYNIKDIPELSFFTLSIISFYFWVISYKKVWFGIFTLVFFLGLGTKFNILFLPFIILPWLFSIRGSFEFKRWFNKKLIFYALIFLIFNLSFFILLWPYLWDSPMEKIIKILNFYKNISQTDVNIETKPAQFLFYNIDIRGILYVFTMTPLIALVGAFAGFIIFIKKQINERFAVNSDSLNIYLLIFLWFIIPLSRTLLPGAEILESMRQYMEFLPALAVLSGIGIGSVLAFTVSRLNITKSGYVIFSGLIIGIYIFYLCFINILYHPNEQTFFNILTGGAYGAEKNGLLGWQTSYDIQYRQGIDWLNNHAENNAKLAYLDGTMLGIPAIWLRNDIHFGSFFSGFERKGEYILSVVYPQAPQVFPYLYLDRFLIPVYKIKVKGAVIARIWKNDKEHLKKDYQHTAVIKNIAQTKGSDKFGEFWEINLEKKYKVNSLFLQIPKSGCDNRDGIFYLSDFFASYHHQISPSEVEFDFPAEETDKIRFYSLLSNTCFEKGKVKDIMVVDR